MAGTNGTVTSVSSQNVATVSFPASAGPPPVAAYTEDYDLTDKLFQAFVAAMGTGLYVNTTGTAPALGTVTFHKT